MNVMASIRDAVSDGSDLHFNKSEDGNTLECRLLSPDGKEHAIGYSEVDENTDKRFVYGLRRFMEDKR